MARITHPTLHRCTEQTRQRAAAYSEAADRYSEAEATQLGAQALLDRADEVDAKRVEDDIIAGGDGLDVPSAQAEAQAGLRSAELVMEAQSRIMRREGQPFFEALQAERAAQIAALEVELSPIIDKVNDLIAQLRQAESAALRLASERVWWLRLGQRNGRTLLYQPWPFAAWGENVELPPSWTQTLNIAAGTRQAASKASPSAA